ncbi:hypothetical protein Leryth_009448 [Lithospermum erythrorhizon]|nr:hypothetical protein Leryth_009448 [Lithospermum erythrorhizon]
MKLDLHMIESVKGPRHLTGLIHNIAKLLKIVIGTIRGVLSNATELLVYWWACMENDDQKNMIQKGNLP